MFIVEKLNNGVPTGTYFKRGKYNSRWDSTLVKNREDATVFRSRSGLLNSLGDFIILEPPRKISKWRTQYSKRVLDETKWKIHEMKMQPVCQSIGTDE